MSRGVVSNEDNGPQSGSCFNRLLSLCQNKSIGWVGLTSGGTGKCERIRSDLFHGGGQ